MRISGGDSSGPPAGEEEPGAIPSWDWVFSRAKFETPITGAATVCARSPSSEEAIVDSEARC